MLLLSIAPFFVRFDAPSDASNCAALSYNMSMQAYAQMRLMMIGVACMLFFLLGFVFSHCIDCVWREAFTKQATKRLTDRRLIESLDSERRALSLQRGADSRLNHMMKNKCGAAVQLLELMQHERTTGAYASARVEKQPRAGSSLAEEPVALEEAIVSLKQAIEWLHRRQVFIELESGSYHSRQTCCSLQLVLRPLLTETDVLQIDPEASGAMLVDETILGIVVEEALSNARKYRREGTPIEVRVAYSADELTLTVRNINKLGMRPLSEAECVAAFLPGATPRMPSSTSDGMGLDSVSLCVSAVNGRAELASLPRADGAPCTTFCVVLPASVAVAPTAAPTASAPVEPPATAGQSTGAAVRWSHDARPSSTSPIVAPPPIRSPIVGPAASSSVSPMAEALVLASAPTPSPAARVAQPAMAAVASVPSVPAASEPPDDARLPSGMRVLVADDMRLNRKLLVHMFQRIATGWQMSEADSGDEALRRVLQEGDEFDLIVMDEYFIGSELLGSDVVRQMRAANIHTPIVSCSGNASSSPDDSINNRFREAGSDLVWSKPLPNWRDGTLQRQLRSILVRDG